MKQYVVDELRPADYDRIKSHLDEHFGPAELGGVYWIPLDPNLLTGKQLSHGDCRPFFFAVELQEHALVCELLVRTRQRVRCDCIAYADRSQREWVIGIIDAVFEKLGIKT